MTSYRLLSQITTIAFRTLSITKSFTSALFFNSFKVNGSTRLHYLSSQPHLLSELGSLSKSASDLSFKINDFISQEAGLHNHVTDTAKALNSISHSAKTPEKSLPTMQQMLLNNSQKENTASAMSSCLIQRSQQLMMLTRIPLQNFVIQA